MMRGTMFKYTLILILMWLPSLLIAALTDNDQRWYIGVFAQSVMFSWCYALREMDTCDVDNLDMYAVICVFVILPSTFYVGLTNELPRTMWIAYLIAFVQFFAYLLFRWLFRLINTQRKKQ